MAREYVRDAVKLGFSRFRVLEIVSLRRVVFDTVRDKFTLPAGVEIKAQERANAPPI